MWTVIAIVGVVVLIGLFLVVAPGSPSREMRNRRVAQAGWRSGGQVGWFHDDRRD